MQNRYSIWTYALLGLLVLLAALYSLPNLYPEEPTIQISGDTTSTRLTDILVAEHIPYKSIVQKNQNWEIRFKTTDNQLKAQDLIKTALGPDYTVALNLSPSTPAWLNKLGAEPMKQGLDLRGGVHFLLDVDINSVVSRRITGMVKNLGVELRQAHIRYAGIKPEGTEGFQLRFRAADARDDAFNLIARDYPDLLLTREKAGAFFELHAKLSPAELTKIRQSTLEQTMSILRNRVNELGVGEAVVQQQGATRVAVDLPGIQDAARAKQILGGTATLQFHMVDHENDASAAKKTGIVPAGSKLYELQGEPILLQNQVVLSGDSITSAMATFDQQSATPAVGIQLGGGGEGLFLRTTRENIGKRMAIVFVETKAQKRSERLISAPVIQSALGNNFQITGLSDTNEARDLSLLLRAGALPAAIEAVEERTVGPTLGKENIRRGLISLEVGLGVILFIMLIYYRMFGLFANVALILNLLFLIAILSIIGNTLTLPGIAGIVLTVGMAVDANVLIYERIREELRNGTSPQAAIYAGYERAFTTIVDANVTTLIVTVILFAIGTGPVRGFAVVLTIGLLTSMLTAVTYTRAITNLVYGHRQAKQLSIGI